MRKKYIYDCSNTRCENKVQKPGWFCNECRKKNLHLTNDEKIKLELDRLERKNGKR